MALHPQARAAVEAYAAELRMTDPAFDVRAAREADRAAAAQDEREPVAAVVEVDADGVSCRLYRPAGADALVVHLHGGGFVFHDLDTHDAACRRLANRTGTAVLSIGYRLAPEHPFPAARDDVDTVLRWLARETAALGLEGPAYVHGDSAGANLALVAALRNPGRFAAVALIYPFLDPSADFDSYRTAADAFDAAEAAWYWQQYADPADLTHPDVAPLLTDRLATLPPTLVVTAEHDPLRDEGEELVRLLAEAGVQVVGTRYLGQVHGFWRQPELFDAAEPLTRHVAGFLRQHAG
jgi:acetyl esterase